MGGPSPVGRRARLGAGVLFAAALLALSACTGSSYHYVKNGSNGSGTYFKVPEAWHIYDENAFFKQLDLGPEQAKARKASTWAVAFDASSKPTLKHFDDPVTAQPFGIAEVRQLDQEERDSFSLMAMRNLVIPVDQIAEQGDSDQLEVLRLDEFTRDGGFHGLRFTFNIRFPDSKRFVTFDQVSIIDSDTKELHLLVVSCSSRCYQDKKDTINTIMDSWTVKER